MNKYTGLLFIGLSFSQDKRSWYNLQGSIHDWVGIVLIKLIYLASSLNNSLIVLWTHRLSL